MPRLILVRHGRTDWNDVLRYQGHSDIPLNETGRRQALALARRLRGEGIQLAFCSDLLRARQTTAAILGREAGDLLAGDLPARDGPVPCTLDPRLRELNFGRWEGLTYDEIDRSYPSELAAWRADPVNLAPPGGERVADLMARVGAALRAVVEANGDQTVLVVAHGGSLQALAALALGMTPRIPGQLRMEHGSVSELLVSAAGPEQGWLATLTLLNDTRHLKDVRNGG